MSRPLPWECEKIGLKRPLPPRGAPAPAGVKRTPISGLGHGPEWSLSWNVFGETTDFTDERRFSFFKQSFFFVLLVPLWCPPLLFPAIAKATLLSTYTSSSAIGHSGFQRAIGREPMKCRNLIPGSFHGLAGPILKCGCGRLIAILNWMSYGAYEWKPRISQICTDFVCRGDEQCLFLCAHSAFVVPPIPNPQWSAFPRPYPSSHLMHSLRQRTEG